jgi:streptogramin lyase
MLGRSGRIGIAATLCAAAVAIGAPAAKGYVYWADELGGTIGRAANDGSAIEPNFISGAEFPDAVAVNATHVFWANKTGEAIGRANIDGTGVDQNFIPLGVNPSGIAVSGSYIFWSSTEGGVIGRANLDGSNPKPSLLTAELPCGVAVDAGHVYWAELGADAQIGRASLGGLSPEPGFVDAKGSLLICGVAVDELNIFWAEHGFATGTRIGRADVTNGGSADPSFIDGGSAPCGVASFGSQLFWANLNTNTIGRANKNATGVDQTFIPTGGAQICGVAVDGLSRPPPPPSGGPAADTTAPTATISKGPGRKLKQGIAKFGFKSSEPGSTFQCKLDSKKAARCRSPKTYKKLKPGRHPFKVWAIDAAGNRSKPAKRSFRVPA